VVPAPRPVLEERWSMTRAFSVTPRALGMAGGALVVVLLVLGWLFGIVGRDRRPGESSASLGGAVTEYVPPEGIRPAQAGLLMDEVVNPVAIPATVVDLAVRGYLRIEEDPANDDWAEKPDWRLVKLKTADNDLLEYERVLLGSCPIAGVNDDGRRFSSRPASLRRRTHARVQRSIAHPADPR
jgi:hypothetical protein